MSDKGSSVLQVSGLNNVNMRTMMAIVQKHAPDGEDKENQNEISNWRREKEGQNEGQPMTDRRRHARKIQ